jgi:hypothetical protein
VPLRPDRVVRSMARLVSGFGRRSGARARFPEDLAFAPQRLLRLRSTARLGGSSMTPLHSMWAIQCSAGEGVLSLPIIVPLSKPVFRAGCRFLLGVLIWTSPVLIRTWGSGFFRVPRGFSPFSLAGNDHPRPSVAPNLFILANALNIVKQSKGGTICACEKICRNPETLGFPQ